MCRSRAHTYFPEGVWGRTRDHSSSLGTGSERGAGGEVAVSPCSELNDQHPGWGGHRGAVEGPALVAKEEEV